MRAWKAESFCGAWQIRCANGATLSELSQPEAEAIARVPTLLRQCAAVVTGPLRLRVLAALDAIEKGARE